MQAPSRAKQCNKANQRQHYGRKKRYEIYRLLRKRERGHVERIERHMKKYKDNSSMARNALEKYRGLIVQK